jgi:hypothetical protein
MNKTFTIILFLLSIYNSLFGQEIDLQQDNTEYLINFDSTKNGYIKLNLIREKLLRDKIFIPDSCVSISKMSGNEFKHTYFCNRWKNQSGKECGKKILHYIFYKNGNEMFQLNESTNPNSKRILDLLNEQNIDKIINFDSKMSTIFGNNADGTNSIVIYTNDRKIKRIIKEFRKQKNGS